MNKHFLEELAENSKRDNLLNEVGKSVHNISEERIKIGKKIHSLLEDGFDKKEIIDIISKNTFLSISNITSIIEEYLFNKRYSVETHFSISEIRIIKKIFKEKKYSFEEEIAFLKQDNIKNILLSEHQILSDNNNKRFKHTISFDQEGEELLQSLKTHLTKILDKKISYSELIYYALIELNSSYPSEEIDIFEDTKI